jgi:hypothetical protein
MLVQIGLDEMIETMTYLSGICKVVTLKFNPDTINMTCVSYAKDAIVNLKIQPSQCDVYEVKGKYSICIDTNNFLELLRFFRLKTKTFSFSHEEDESIKEEKYITLEDINIIADYCGFDTMKKELHLDINDMQYSVHILDIMDIKYSLSYYPAHIKCTLKSAYDEDYMWSIPTYKFDFTTTFDSECLTTFINKVLCDSSDKYTFEFTIDPINKCKIKLGSITCSSKVVKYSKNSDVSPLCNNYEFKHLVSLLPFFEKIQNVQLYAHSHGVLAIQLNMRYMTLLICIVPIALHDEDT